MRCTQKPGGRVMPVDAASYRWAAELSRAFSDAGQPQAAFRAFDRLCADMFGHRLFTILAWQAGADELERVYSSRPAEYPVSARKRMGPTPWGEHVLRQGRSWLGSNAQDMRWAFPDHELIASLGCAACLNAPVHWNSTVLGAINILDAEGSYTPPDLEALEAISGFLVGPLLAARSQA
jgi:GAF domain-containing protein